MVYFLRTGTLRNTSDWLPLRNTFFYFRKTWSLFSHAGCVLTQEEMPRKEKEKAKMLQLRDQELLLHYSPEPQQHQLLVLPNS